MFIICSDFHENISLILCFSYEVLIIITNCAIRLNSILNYRAKEINGICIKTLKEGNTAKR